MVAVTAVSRREWPSQLMLSMEGQGTLSPTPTRGISAEPTGPVTRSRLCHELTLGTGWGQAGWSSSRARASADLVTSWKAAPLHRPLTIATPVGPVLVPSATTHGPLSRQ